jgi:hypothetical protein
MTVNTRNTQYNHPGPPSDTEMEDAQAPLTIHAPPAEIQQTGPPVRAIQPITHQGPTTIQAATPHEDLTALIDSIPAPIHIENIQFTMQQNTTVHFNEDLACL